MKYGVPRHCRSQNDGHANTCVLGDKEERIIGGICGQCIVVVRE